MSNQQALRIATPLRTAQATGGAVLTTPWPSKQNTLVNQRERASSEKIGRGRTVQKTPWPVEKTRSPRRREAEK